MREIKFRAFGASGKMIEWDELKKLHAATIFWESEHYHIMQYTGLNDKNLKQIYEGDILKDSKGIGEVKWIQEHCAFIVFVREPSGYNWLINDIGKLNFTEVIGNILENPELLKDGKI
jgi:uncharacterized phage protein (TIGR01671 family)